MKYLFASLYLLILTISVKAQISTNDIPYGFLSDLRLKSSAQQLKLGKIDIKSYLEEDLVTPIPLAYCIYIDTLLNLKAVANKINVENGNIWTYKILTENAKSINAYLSHFEIPNGAKLFVYNKKEGTYLGAFTNANQKTNKTLQIADLKGSELTIEYYEPDNSKFEGKIVINSLGLGYRDILDVLSSDFIDVNCKEGNDWQLEKHAVCKLTYKSGLKGYQCSGSLINTTANDGTPYFLTANHCISEEAEANTAVIYFNMEKSECGGTTVVAANQTVSGSQLTATSSNTDFSLLLLAETPPSSYQPYYVGWNRTDDAPNGAFTMHHPSEMAKKISIDNDPISSYPFVLNWGGDEPSPPNSHWQVKFDEGITISGSSGGPLFNLEGQVIGQLHGGDATSGIDYYGKISKSWDLNLLNSHRLKPWLDPINSGETEISGYIPDGVAPDAHFSTKLNAVCKGHPIEFENHSVLNPETFEWIIAPPYIEFVNGTNSTSVNPIIQFDSSATYTITLLAQNENGINQQVFNNYITAGNTIKTSYELEDNSICFYDFNSVKIEPFGADTLYWLTNEIDDYITTIVDADANLYMTLNKDLDTIYSANIKLVGEQGTCIDTSEIQVDIIYTTNDDVQNSLPLEFGENGPFYNECTTIQTNEPAPPVGDNCMGEDYWCDDYGNGTLIIENTTWFSFIAPASGNVTIKTNGFDSQIAVYEANTADDIVSGNLNRYKLLAANDDFTAINPYAQIDSLILTSGKEYWLQVDGYQGAEGIYTIELIDNLHSDILTLNSNKSPVKFYPIPSKTGIFQVNIGNEFNNQEFLLNVYNLNGEVLHSQYLNSESNNINLSKLSQGLYVVQILYGSHIYLDKILISH